MDPDHTGYWPRLADGLDTYTMVRFIGGRALAYTENLYPPVAARTALNAIHDELPADARVVRDTTGPHCRQLVESSAALRALLGLDVSAEMRSAASRLDPRAIASITYWAVSPTRATPPSC